jgi:hypothetical protein
MNIDEIIEQHKAALLSRSETKKHKSFWYIFWEDFSDNQAIRVIAMMFPIIAAVTTLIISLVLCGGCCSGSCCSECIICVAAAADTGPIGLISILFILIPFAIYSSSDSNTATVIADIITAVINLIVLEMFDRNVVITSIAFIIYIVFIYLMLKRPFLKWYKINQ